MAPSPCPISTAPQVADPAPPSSSARNIWDPATQEEHGGQTWQQLGSRFVCDFSVTTNALGTPPSGLKAATNALADVSHYPPADCADALKALGSFCHFDPQRMLLCNGASEMIELLMRAAPDGKFRPSPYTAAYMEYTRAARVAGREMARDGEPAAVSVVIRPNSPTGDHMSLDGMRRFVRDAAGVVVVDESFIAFHGPDWRSVSSLNLIDEFPDKLIVLFSWTKFWCCPGLRLGSVMASSHWIRKIKAMQTPWSCNTLAQAFLIAVAADPEYNRRTWDTLPMWKKEQEDKIRQIGWKINENSPLWVPWVFFECSTEEEAARAVDVAFNAGCPVRHCRSFGIPKCIRVGIRKPEHQQVLHNAWVKEFL